MSVRRTPPAPDLQKALTAVEAAVSAADAKVGPRPAFSDGAYFERRRAVYAECAAQLTLKVAARISDRWDCARVRIAGVAASCTAGLPGALQNWMAAARKKLSA